jgi:hypothetical protein
VPLVAATGGAPPDPDAALLAPQPGTLGLNVFELQGSAHSRSFATCPCQMARQITDLEKETGGRTYIFKLTRSLKCRALAYTLIRS